MRGQAISPAALLDRIGRGEAPAVLDVRSPGEFAAGHVPVPRTLFTSVTGGIGRRARAEVPDPRRLLRPRPSGVARGRGAAPAGIRARHYLRGHMAAWRRAGLREER